MALAGEGGSRYYRRMTTGFDLTKWIRRAWDELERRGVSPRPDLPAFDELIRVAFAVSLRRDEQRPLAFRVFISPPDSFDLSHGPPDGIQPLEFAEPRPFTVAEVAKLSVASDYSRGALGVWPGPGGAIAAWGLLVTGPWWLRTHQGGRGGEDSVFGGLSLHVTGPGTLELAWGREIVLGLHLGQEIGGRMNVFQASWLPGRFAYIRDDILAEHHARHSGRMDELSEIDPMLFSRLTQQMLKRLIASIQSQRHGGTVLILPWGCACAPYGNADVRIKIPFASKQSAARHRTLMLHAASMLANLGANRTSKKVGWDEYAEMSDLRLDVIDSALFEESYLLSALARPDGAVVVNPGFEIVGFGAEILCHDVPITHVKRALDIEGRETVEESLEMMGTRHRSAARLIAKHPDALAIVISQDGSVRLFVNHEGHPTFFEHDDTQYADFVL